MFITIIVLALNVLFNLILIPYFGILGAAIATFISNSAGTLLYITISRKYIPIPINHQQVFFISLLGGVLIMGFTLLNNQIEWGYFISIISKSLIIIGGGGVIYWVFSRRIKRYIGLVYR